MPSQQFREYDVWDDVGEVGLFDLDVAFLVFAEEEPEDIESEEFSFEFAEDGVCPHERACPICAERCPATDLSCQRGQDYFAGYFDASGDSA